MNDYGRDENGKYTGNIQQFNPTELHGETQETIGRWNVETFGPSDDPKPQALRLLQETIELCKVSGVGYLAIMDCIDLTSNEETINEYKMVDEMADVRIVLESMAYRLGVDLQRATNIKMIRNRKRTWKTDGNGVGQHVKEGDES